MPGLVRRVPGHKSSLVIPIDGVQCAQSMPRISRGSLRARSDFELIIVKQFARNKMKRGSPREESRMPPANSMYMYARGVPEEPPQLSRRYSTDWNEHKNPIPFYNIPNNYRDIN